MELISDMGVGADVSICGRDLQDEPASRGVLWDALTIEGLKSRVRGKWKTGKS